MRSLRLSLLIPLAFAGLLASGCGAASEESRASAPQPAAAAKAAAPTLYGRWRIIAINGSAPLSFGAGAADPIIEFSASRYGGSTGCNSFGGTGLLVGDRWFGEPPMATQQGCGALQAQEDAITGIASSGPLVAFEDASEAMLTAPAGSLRLRRESGSDPAAVQDEPMLLAGTAWQVRAVDGGPLSGRPGRHLLRFEAEHWTLEGACARLSGRWLQTGRALRMEVDAPSAGCTPEEAPAYQRLRGAIAALAEYTVGPNRELVMGGGNHWLVGEFDRAAIGEDKSVLLGEWRIDSAGGVKPLQTPRPPSLIFGTHSYAYWDGCNHSEGIQIVLSRQLFTRGSGVSTLAACQADPVRPRIGAILGSNPRIATDKEGGVVLVGASGTLHLSRISDKRFGSGEQVGLRASAAIDLLRPKAKLMLLGANRFAILLECGRIEGEWRGGQPSRFSPGPPERTAPDCESRPGSDAFRLGQFFTGNVHAVTGPNRDIVLLVNEGESIPGRLAG